MILGGAVRRVGLEWTIRGKRVVQARPAAISPRAVSFHFTTHTPVKRPVKRPMKRQVK